METEEYIALLVKKHNILGTNSYLYEPIMTIKGSYDNDREIFQSELGESYYYLQKDDFLVFETDLAIMYPTSYDKLRRLYKSKTRESFDELIKAYTDEHMIESFLAMYNFDTNMSQVLTIDMDSFIETVCSKTSNLNAVLEQEKVEKEINSSKEIKDPF